MATGCAHAVDQLVDFVESSYRVLTYVAYAGDDAGDDSSAGVDFGGGGDDPWAL